jgi:hypothetical protein
VEPTWEGQTTQQAHEGMATDGQAQAAAQACPCSPCQCQGDAHRPGREPLRPPSPGDHEWRRPLGKEAAGAAANSTEELSPLESEHDASGPPGEIGHRADIATMNTPRRNPADWTVDQRLYRGHLPHQLCGGVVHLPGVEV